MDVKFPIGTLPIPTEATTDQIKEPIEQIKTYTKRLRAVVDGLDEASLEKTYREGSWNVRQLVHHIADSQLNMYQRLRLALTDDQPTVPAFDQDRWAVLADTKLPVESSIRMLEGLNERIVALAESLTNDDLKRTFTHADEGEINVVTKLTKLSWHQEHHLAHIKIALQNE